ncbi:MAG: thymidine phosphorylase [Thalassobaculales bacterium]
MFPQDVIRRKRDGAALEEAEIAFFVRGIADGSISEGQAGAFAMAVYFRGMTPAEIAAMTRAMTGSGSRLAWPGLPGPALDKHSTGGVGDKVSLALAPIVAACGGFVPMISGRALGHTGGTLDKLDSIPGYRSQPDIDTFRRVVREAGCAIIGQTADLAPADRRLYAVRDVTATVESIPLITASILSKKLAAGLDGLVMDVKAGSGAFLPRLEDTRALARAIVDTARAAGLPTVALLTDMDQVLGLSAGNTLEVAEAIAFLTGAAHDKRLEEVTLALARAMLKLGGITADPAAAVASGAAAERFQRMVRLLGGPSDLVDRPSAHLAVAPVILPAFADRDGVLAGWDVAAVGRVVLALGGGRRRADDRIDHTVGLAAVAAVGEKVGTDLPLAIVHARSLDDAEAAGRALQAAARIADTAPPPRPVVLETVA